jgi:chorismate mutase/prephenate dehydratase
MSDLSEYRQTIDSIDRQLVALIEQRLDIVLKIAAYKQERGMTVLQSDREEVVLKQAVDHLNNADYAQEIRALFRALLQISRHLQQRTLSLAAKKPPAGLHILEGTAHGDTSGNRHLKLGYQGVAGAFSEEALVTFFGNDHQFFNYNSFEEVCLALSKQEIDYGILPIENSSTGSVNEVYDLILQYGFFIVGEQSLEIQQHLLGLPGTQLAKVKTVYSHPQGLAQCSEFLKQHPHWQQIPYQNTAMSAQLIRDKGEPAQVAIASSRAAKLYGLDVLQPCINDQKDNHTLFIIIGTRPLPHQKNYKASLVFWLENQAGALVKLLNIFAGLGINMTKLESRPVKYRPWEYVFYLDFEGDLTEANMMTALDSARSVVKDLRFIGSYPKNM